MGSISDGPSGEGSDLLGALRTMADEPYHPLPLRRLRSRAIPPSPYPGPDFGRVALRVFVEPDPAEPTHVRYGIPDGIREARP